MTQQVDDKIRFLRGLRAVREFTSEPVSDDALRDILEVGRWAGSASNVQPTEVVVVRDAETKKLIGENGARPAAGAAVVLVILSDDDPSRRDLDSFDLGRLVERLLLAARAHGLGSTVATLKGDGPRVIKERLGVPEGRRVWAVVALGHTDVEARKRNRMGPSGGRKPLEQFAHWDRYESR